MRRFKIMADYESWPIWETTGGQYTNMDPVLLELPQDLVARIEAWADTYDATLKADDPSSSGFPDDDARSAFETEGLSIWWSLQMARPDDRFDYFSELMQRLYGPL